MEARDTSGVFVCRAPPLFDFVSVSAFMVVSTVWSVSCLLFFHSGAPVPSHFKSVGRGHLLPVPYGVGATARNKMLVLYLRARSDLLTSSTSGVEGATYSFLCSAPLVLHHPIIV